MHPSHKPRRCCRRNVRIDVTSIEIDAHTERAVSPANHASPLTHVCTPTCHALAIPNRGVSGLQRGTIKKCKASRINADESTVTLATGESLPYDFLVLATGILHPKTGTKAQRGRAGKGGALKFFVFCFFIDCVLLYRPNTFRRGERGEDCTRYFALHKLSAHSMALVIPSDRLLVCGGRGSKPVLAYIVSPRPSTTRENRACASVGTTTTLFSAGASWPLPRQQSGRGDFVSEELRMRRLVNDQEQTYME